MAGYTDGEKGKNGRSNVARRKVVDLFDAEFKGFINLNLDASQKREFPAWAGTTDMAELLSRHCTDGIVLSVKVDGKSGGFLASGTQRRVASQNAGLAVTARAGDPLTALWRLLFMLEILPSDGWEKMQPMADPDRW